MPSVYPLIRDRKQSGCGRSGQCSLVRALVLLLAAGPAALHAQTPAATFAPHDHWTRAVLRRIALDGAISAGAATAAWPLREDVIARLLESAAAQTALTGAATHVRPRTPLGGFARLFSYERNDLVGDARLRISARAGATFDGRWNALRAGNSVPVAAGYEYGGPVPLDDRRAVGALLDVDVGWNAFALRVTANPPHEEWREVYATASAGTIALWGGRRGLSIGPTTGGGIVLGNAVRFSGGGVETAEPFRLPGFLRMLGDIRVSQTLARMERSGDIDDPWFLATRISLAPHARFALGLNRAAIFGGEGNEGVTARRVVLMLIGLGDVRGKDSDFENQIASFDVYWRPPARFPIALYAEYATEDRAGAIIRVPAYLLGVEASPRRGSAWSGALEHVRFSHSTGTYPEWYRHGALGGGWTDDGTLLGLPIGGHGQETSFALRYDDAARRVTASARISLRDRGDENLFSPDRAGDAIGLAARFTYHLVPGVRLDVWAAGERGEAWRSGTVRVALLRAF